MYIKKEATKIEAINTRIISFIISFLASGNLVRGICIWGVFSLLTPFPFSTYNKLFGFGVGEYGSTSLLCLLWLLCDEGGESGSTSFQSTSMPLAGGGQFGWTPSAFAKVLLRSGGGEFGSTPYPCSLDLVRHVPGDRCGGNQAAHGCT